MHTSATSTNCTTEGDGYANGGGDGYMNCGGGYRNSGGDGIMNGGVGFTNGGGVGVGNVNGDGYMYGCGDGGCLVQIWVDTI